MVLMKEGILSDAPGKRTMNSLGQKGAGHKEKKQVQTLVESLRGKYLM